MTHDAIKAKAKAKVRSQSTEILVGTFELTDHRVDNEYVPTVRGWIMDELESRNPEAFDLWVDSAEDSPRRFFLH